MLKEIVDYFLILVLLVLAISPALVLRGIDKYIFNKDNVRLFGRDIFNEPLEIDIGDGESWFNQPERIERDEKVLKNLCRMESESISPAARNMWKMKRLAFERQMRWYAVMDAAKGHETLPTV